MKDYYPSFYQQTKEILVREIRDAQRWSAIEEAALALLQVRNMGGQMEKEARHLAGVDKDDCHKASSESIDGQRLVG